MCGFFLFFFLFFFLSNQFVLMVCHKWLMSYVHCTFLKSFFVIFIFKLTWHFYLFIHIRCVVYMCSIDCIKDLEAHKYLVYSAIWIQRFKTFCVQWRKHSLKLVMIHKFTSTFPQIHQSTLHQCFPTQSSHTYQFICVWSHYNKTDILL